jgi:hypothetical protein
MRPRHRSDEARGGGHGGPDVRSVAQAFGRARLPHNDRHLPLLFARRLHRDLDVLPERSEKLDQAADGKISRAVAHQRGDVGLLDPRISPARACVSPRCLMIL